MLLLQCYDDNPKHTVAQRIAEACAAYVARFGCSPNLVLVNEADVGAVVAGCEIKVSRYVGRNNYQVTKQD